VIRVALDQAGLAALRALPRRGLPQRVVLRVPPALLLERIVVLPAAAEADWRSVLGYEIVRLTPFAADAVYWSGRLEGRDAARGKISLRLSIVPKAAVAPVIAALTEAAMLPTVIEVAQANEVRVLRLAAAQTDTNRRNVARVLGGVCAGLAVLAVALPFITQSRQLGAVAHRIDVLRPEVARAAALRRQIMAGSSSLAVIAQERLRTGDPLAVLAAVTDALPDDTYVTELSLRHLDLQLAGQSGAAAPLLAALSANPSLDAVTFAAPVTRDARSHKDLFTIKATIRPAAGAPP
jgi:general secretion pathway protein L